MIKVLLVDDHQVIIEGLEAVLKSSTEIDVVGSAKNGRYALKMIEEVSPNVVLLDINMPVMDGVTCTENIAKHYPQIRVIALSMHHETRLVKRMIKSGASGFLLKNSSTKKIEEAINVVFDGGRYFDQALMTSMFDIDYNRKSSFSKIEILTPRELEIVKLICEEKTGPEIAENLHISINTVESHRANIFSKLGVKNIAGLVKWAIKNAVVDL